VAANFIGRFLVPPAFPDERQTLAVRKLWAILIVLLAATTAAYTLLALNIPGSTARSVKYLCIFDTGYIGLLCLARRGRTRLVSVLLLAFTAFLITFSAWTAGGVRAPGMMVFLLLVGVAGILEGSVAAALTAVACCLLSLGLLIAERMGRLPPPSIKHNAGSNWILLVLIMFVLVVVQIISSWVVRRAEESALASARERERTEAALRDTAEKFAKVFQASPDAIVISDLKTGEIIEANPGYEKLFGYSHSELVGRTTVGLGVFDNAIERQSMVDAIRAGSVIRDREMSARNRKGGHIPLLFSGELIELGNRICLVSVIHDITGRKKAEARERLARDEFTRKLLASQEEERRRIAGELHDSLGQNLILIKNRAQLALEIPAVPPSLRSEFRNLQDMAAQAIAEVRQISRDLRPHQLDQLGLTRALEAMIDGAAQNSNLPIERKLDPVDDLFTPEAATHLYRVAQESISNILKHARARCARIGLERDIREVRLWIEDDGRGFVSAPAKSGSSTTGFGLSGIAERARIIGGALRIDSTPGRGTRVEVVIPHTEIL
jgi:PAS domain S-box-containing protein